MALIQPGPNDTLLSDNHVLMHKVFAIDAFSPAESVVVNSSGQVGIGTTSPAQTLDVNGNLYIRGANALILNGSGFELNSDGSDLYLKSTGNILLGTSTKVGIGTNSPTDYLSVSGGNIALTSGQIYGPSNGPISINTSSNGNVLLAVGGGQVGIGTSSPSQTLEVAGNGYIHGILDLGGTVAVVQGVNGVDLSLNPSGGNVGIGTTSPTHTLDVNGTINASGAITGEITSGSSLLSGNGSGGFSNVTIGTGLSFSGGTLSNTVTGMTLVATATPSAVSSFTFSGLSSGVRYYLSFSLFQNTSGGVPKMLINSDTANYTNTVGCFYTSGSLGNSAGTANVSLSFNNTDNVDANTFFNANLYINTSPNSNNNIGVYGNVDYSNTSSFRNAITYSHYSGASPLSTITISTSAGTVTGTAKLYQLN